MKLSQAGTVLENCTINEWTIDCLIPSCSIINLEDIYPC